MTPEQGTIGVFLGAGATGSVVSTGLLTADMLETAAVFFACMSGGMMSLTYMKSSLSFARKILVAIGSGLTAFNSYEVVYEFIPRFDGYDRFTGFTLGFLAFNLLGGLFVASSKFSKSPLAFFDWAVRRGERPGNKE